MNRIRSLKEECAHSLISRREKAIFPFYLKVSLSFPYAVKREQTRFDIRVRREMVFLSSFCRKKKMEVSSEGNASLSQPPLLGPSAQCSSSSLRSEDGTEPSGPKSLTSFRKQAVGAWEMQQVETMERKDLVEPRSTGRGAWL